MPNKFENYEEPPEEKLPERPLECSDCKKPIENLYSEIVGNSIIRTCMCSDCPVLERHLFGINAGENNTRSAQTGMACGNCGTTLDALRMGTPLGCSTCYEVFEEVIITELLALGKIHSRLSTTKKTDSLHIGRIQGLSQEISASMRLLALNEALTETLKREDYEQAALLRDQIKALEDHKNESEKGDGG